MRASSLAGAWLLLLAGATVPAARAQDAAAPPKPQPAKRARVRVSVNAGAEMGSIDFSSAVTTPLYLEAEGIDATYGVGRGPVFDGGVLYRLAGGFHVGVAVSSLSGSHDSPVSAAIPHPFFYNRPRSLTGTTAVERHELATHLQAAYVVQAGRHMDVAVSVGPSWFTVRQDLVSGVAFTETYPYDSAALASIRTTEATDTHSGVNAGVDVGLRLAKNVGVGGIVRYSHTSVQFQLPGSAAPVKSDAGGTFVGGGLRLYF